MTDKTCFDCIYCTQDGIGYDYCGRYGFSGNGMLYCRLNGKGIFDGTHVKDDNPCEEFEDRPSTVLSGPLGGGDIIDNEGYEINEEEWE